MFCHCPSFLHCISFEAVLLNTEISNPYSETLGEGFAEGFPSLCLAGAVTDALSSF